MAEEILLVVARARALGHAIQVGPRGPAPVPGGHGRCKRSKSWWPSAYAAAVRGWWGRGLMDVGRDLEVGLAGASGRQL